MKVITEITPTAPKFMLYGLPGTGKTTLASQMDKSIIVDVEGGANYIKTPRTPQINSLTEFYQVMVELYRSPKREYDTIVIDSVDWLMRLVIEQVAGIDKDHLDETLNRSNGGYGNGKQVLENHVRTRLLPMLIKMNQKGYGICLIAHADKKEMLDSDGTTIKQITPKIDPTTLNAFIEWCDAIYYLKKDSITGKRSLLFESDDVALAKNRFNQTGEIDLSKNNINDILKNNNINKEGE